MARSKKKTPDETTDETRPAASLSRGEATRQRILATAEQLFSERGYDGTTFTAIAEAVGIHQPGIFYYFPDKTSLYDAVVEELLRAHDGSPLSIYRQDLPAQERILRATDRWIDAITERPTRAKLILQEIAISSRTGNRANLHRTRRHLLATEIHRALSECAGRPIDHYIALHFLSTIIGATLYYFAAADDTVIGTARIDTLEQESIDRYRSHLRETALMLIESAKRAPDIRDS